MRSYKFVPGHITSGIFKYGFVGIFCLFALIPLVFVLLSSFKTNIEINRVLTLPSSFYLDNFNKVFQNPIFLSGLFNSLIITSTSLVIGILAASLAGYAIGRTKGKVFGVVYLFFLMSLLIPAASNLTAIYVLIKSLNLLDSQFGLIVLYSAGVVPFGVLLYASFIKNIPLELDEAAIIDGCGYFGRFFRIVLPLLKPAVVTHALLNAVGIWNDYLLPFLLITSDSKKTLPMAVISFQSNNVTDYGPIFAIMTLAIIPPALLFLLTQRYFYNTLAGAIKA